MNALLCIRTAPKNVILVLINNFEFIQHNIQHIELMISIKLAKSEFQHQNFPVAKITERNTVHAVSCIHVQQQFYAETKDYKAKHNRGSKVKTLPLRSFELQCAIH